MDLFEFIVGIISVILALALAQMFLGLASLIQRVDPVRLSLDHSAWVISLFLLTFIHWWSLWDFREIVWNFPRFLFALSAPSLMFFAATLINPKEVASGPMDLADHFQQIRRPFFVVFIVMGSIMTMDGPMFGTEPLFNNLRVIQLAVILCAFAALVVASKRARVFSGIFACAVLAFATIVRFTPGMAQ
ncbi:MAG: hypothetical protein AB8B81_18455 [Halioglobus sp.]